MAEQSALQQALQGLFQGGVGLAGAAIVGEDNRSGFSQQFIRVSEEAERRREADRQRNENFVRQIALSNPAAFAHLPVEFQNAVAEPVAEQSGGKLNLEQAREGINTALTTEQPLTRKERFQQGTAIAQLGAKIGSQDLLDEGTQLMGVVSGQIPTEGLSPEILMSGARLMEDLTDKSQFLFSQDLMNGKINLNNVEFKTPDENTTQEEVTNMLAHRAIISYDNGEIPEYTERLALMKKIGPDVPQLTPNAMASALAKEMGTGILIEAGKLEGGIASADNIAAVSTPAMVGVGKAVDAMGLTTASPALVEMLFHERILWHNRLKDPLRKDAAINEIRESLRGRNPNISEDQLDQLTADRVDLIRGTK